MGDGVLDEVGLVVAGSVDRGSLRGLLAAATHREGGTAEEGGQSGYSELEVVQSQ